MEKQEKRKGFLIAAIVFFAVAAVLLVVMMSHIATTEPPMTDPNWFEEATKRASGITFSAMGAGTCFFIGFAMLMIYGRAGMRMVQGGTNAVADMLSKFREAVNPSKPEPEKYFCRYCGAQLGDGDLFCISCGARRTEKK